MTLAEIIANAGSNSEFVPGMSSNELFFGTLTDERLTDVIADVAEACQGKAESDHTHTGFAPSTHSHDGYAPSDHSHNYAEPIHYHPQAYINGLTEDLAGKADLNSDGKIPVDQMPDRWYNVYYGHMDDGGGFRDAVVGARLAPTIDTLYVDTNTGKIYMYNDGYQEVGGVSAAQKAVWDSKANGNHTHGADLITAHMEAVTYNAPVGGTWTNIPLTNLVLVGNSFALIDNQVRIGAGVSKVLISAQICVGSTSVEGIKYFAIRKNSSQDKARTQIRLHEAHTPETMCIPPLLIDVTEGDLLTIDYSGAQGDAIYGELIFTYLTVQKIA